MWQWEVRGVAMGGRVWQWEVRGVAMGGRGVATGGKGCDNLR